MGLLEPICAVGVYYNTRHVLVLMKTVSKINLSCATSLFDSVSFILFVLRNDPRIYDIRELYEL